MHIKKLSVIIVCTIIITLGGNKCLLNKGLFLEEADEIIFKTFSDILSLVSGAYYPPRSKKIINLIGRLKKDSFSKSTLGGCIIEKKVNSILISKEENLKKNKITAKNLTIS